jgi:hypothetical protein
VEPALWILAWSAEKPLLLATPVQKSSAESVNICASASATRPDRAVIRHASPIKRSAQANTTRWQIFIADESTPATLISHIRRCPLLVIVLGMCIRSLHAFKIQLHNTMLASAGLDSSKSQR